MKRPDLIMPIAIWEFLTALGILIPIYALFVVGFVNMPDWGMWGGGWDMSWLSGLMNVVIGSFLFIFVAYFILALMGGIWLLQGHEMGRVMSIVHTALTLFWIPIGTIVGALILVYLTRSETREYFQT